MFDSVLFFPDKCAVCATEGPSPCSLCVRQFRPPPALARPAGVDGLVALFSYEGEARKLVSALKYRNRRGSLKWLSSELVERLGQLDVDCVTWVPSSQAGRIERGFDSGQLLARLVARQLRVPARRLLVRESGERQTARTRSERAVGPNLHVTRSAFSVSRVLIVDDVCTTGASLSSAALLLKECGVKTAWAAVAARTPVKQRVVVLPEAVRI